MKRKRAGSGEGECGEGQRSCLKRQRNKGMGNKVKGEFWFGFWVLGLMFL